MNSLLIACLLSACPGGQCSIHCKPNPPSPAVVLANQRQAVLNELFRLRYEIQDARRALREIPIDMQPDDDGKLSDANADKRQGAKDSVAELQRRIDRLQDWLVWSNRANARHYPLPPQPNLVGTTQSLAVRASLRNVYRMWR